jgi:hypothetical protein
MISDGILKDLTELKNPLNRGEAKFCGCYI